MNEEEFQKYYKNIRKEEIIKELFYKCKVNYEVAQILKNCLEYGTGLNIEYLYNILRGEDNGR